MADHSKQRLDAATELTDLFRQQIKTVKDATFIGWESTESAAYEERWKRIALLRNQLAALDVRASLHL